MLGSIRGRILVPSMLDQQALSQKKKLVSEREFHYVHLASLAYEDGIVFMSEPSAARRRERERERECTRPFSQPGS